MLLLGLDLETGGAFSTPHSENFITEIGAVLWDTDLKRPVKMFSFFLDLQGKKISQDCIDYTGITDEMCEVYGENPEYVKAGLINLMEHSDFIVAQNGNKFDRPILEAWMGDRIPQKVWLDTKEDVPYPKECKANSLIYLSGFHGFVNPFPHRALFDVCAMMKVLSYYDIHAVIENATAPKMIIAADVSFDNKELAKTRGFSWQECDGKSYFKKWVKKIRKNEFERYREEYPFPIYIMEDLGNGQ